MENNNIYIITNESISEKNESYLCDNLDLKSIPEGLNKLFHVNLIGRFSKQTRNHLIQNIKIKIAKNIFSFLSLIFQSLKNKKQSKYLVISISPFTFAACIMLFFFRVRPIVYLRSDGYEEYKSISGIFGVFIYHIMFSLTSKISNLISCRDHILKNKFGKVISPSQLTEKWIRDHKAAELDAARLLYVGRLRVEKGIFSMLKILKHIKQDFQLNIVSTKKDHSKIEIKKNINCIDTQPENSLIEIYDKNNIFILPSFTEGHPQVLDEALARLRPVIVFEEIKHVKRNREGIFVCKRDAQELDNTIDYILNNYPEIQSKIKRNKLPNKESFLKELELIIMETSNKERWPSG